MSYRVEQFRHLIVRPTLRKLDVFSNIPYSLSAEILLLGTAATESRFGSDLKQIGGPALGIYQIEPATLESIKEDYLSYRPMTRQAAEQFASPEPWRRQLITSLTFASVIARLVYWRRPEAMPHHDDLQGLANYYKQHFNTPAGKGSPEKFIADYQKYVLNG